DQWVILAGVTGRVCVGIGLVGVGDRRAIVARVADSIGVDIILARICLDGAIIGRVGLAVCVAVAVGVCEPGARAGVLAGIGNCGAIIARVAHPVTVLVELVLI